MRFHTGKINIENIPLRYSYFQHPLDEEIIVVDCMSAVKDEYENSHHFFGHAAGYDYAEALMRAGYEVIERMLAFQCTFSTAELANGFISKQIFDDSSTGKQITYDQVLVRTINHMSSASGLGLHSNKKLAIEHGVYELIERDILCKIWYFDNKVVLLKREELSKDFYIEFYTDLQSHLPFVLAIIKSHQQRIMYCGSCCSGNWKRSFNKAREEALHLLTNYLCRDQQSATGNNADTISRINKLYGENAERLNQYFEQKIVNPSGFNSYRDNVFEEIVHLYFDDISQLRIVDIRKWGSLYLIKAMSNSVISKQMARQMVTEKLININVPDPFC